MNGFALQGCEQCQLCSSGLDWNVSSGSTALLAPAPALADLRYDQDMDTQESENINIYDVTKIVHGHNNLHGKNTFIVSQDIHQHPTNTI